MANHATVRSVGRKPALPQNNRPSPQGQAAVRTGTGFADGFLRSAFVPRFASDGGFLKDYRILEQNFFASLGYLKSLYGFETEDVSAHPFPQNIIKAYKSAKETMETEHPELGLVIMQNERTWAALATYAEYNIDRTLFYIPIRPLFDLFKDRYKQKTVLMLMSVYAYLKDILKIPFYIFPDAYLYNVYDCFRDYLFGEGDCNGDDYFTSVSHILKNADRKGRAFLIKISRREHLEDFEKRIKGFSPYGKWENDVWKVCKSFYRLYRKYPNRKISDSIRNGFLEPQEEERMYFQHYLSFAWDMDDMMTRELIGHINTDLQETGTIEQPMSIQVFDKPQRKITLDLCFEKALFKLIDRLIGLLFELK